MIHDADAAVGWWRVLQPEPERGRRGDRAALARLRRCTGVTDAMFEPAAIDLFRACRADSPNDLETVSLAAVVLSHVRKDAPGEPVARQVGMRTADAVPVMKPLRFQRLMTATTPDERLTAMRRLVALASGELNLRDLSRSLLRWNRACRLRWTYDYWGAGRPPALPPVATEDLPA